jgi:hypothetical protein
MLTLSKAALVQPLVIGIASSLVASALFLVMFRLLLERDLVDYYIATTVDETIERISASRLAMVPSKVFPSSETPLENFEEDFDRLFSGSTLFSFKGASASFLAYRLTEEKSPPEHHSLEVRVLILDPTAEDLLEAHARRALARQGDFRHSTLSQKKKALRTTILENTLAFHELRHKFDIDVRYHRDFVFYRAEIFSGGLFLSYYDGGKHFPASALFGPETVVYRAHRLDTAHAFERYAETSSKRFESDSAEEHLAALGFQDDLATLRRGLTERHEEYRKGFARDFGQ